MEKALLRSSLERTFLTMAKDDNFYEKKDKNSKEQIDINTNSAIKKHLPSEGCRTGRLNLALTMSDRTVARSSGP